MAATNSNNTILTANGAGQQPKISSQLHPSNFPQSRESPHIHVSLTYDHLDTATYLQFTRSPSAGANVLFLGTTRNSFDSRPVSRLSYSAYPALALRTLFTVATNVREKYNLEKVVIVHRLGDVPIGEESIAVCVSAGHRQAGWQGAEEILERVKERAEIWKREWFGDTPEGQVEEGAWRANRDTNGSQGTVQEHVSDLVSAER